MKLLKCSLAAVVLCSLGEALPVRNVFAQDQKSVAQTQELSLPDGISLPRSGMVFALDTTTHGPVLIKLHATEVVSNSHPGQNLLRSQVYLGAHSSIEINGINSSISIETPMPSFYVRMSGDDPDLLKSRLHLVRLVQTKDRRVVTNHSQNIFGGQQAKKYDDIAITKTDFEADVWLKVTPTSPLTAGEYGIVLMPKDKNFVPDVVYDFDTAEMKSKATP
jgi:hypothetical protein